MSQNTIPETIFSRSSKIAEWIEAQVRELEDSLDAAIYRFSSRALCRVLKEAADRGIKVRLVIDRNKFEESSFSQDLLARPGFPVRLSYGRQGRGSKLHHKFAVLDRKAVLTGSYNWTPESEDENFENLVVLREARLVERYREEFEVLWSGAKTVEED